MRRSFLADVEPMILSLWELVYWRRKRKIEVAGSAADAVVAVEQLLVVWHVDAHPSRIASLMISFE